MTRTGGEIGLGISPARTAKTLSAADRLHVVGVGGVAAMGAALHAAALGVHVTGVDDRLSPSAGRILRDAGVVLVDGSDVSPLKTATSLAVSKAVTSIRPDHPQLEAARAAGVPIISVQQVIADAAATYGGPLLAVAGTHGKTTSTGWLLELLRASGVNPAAFIGGPLPEGTGTPPGSPVHLGDSPGFIVEADEYAGNFDAYAADCALILNVDWDHPDVFRDRRAVIEEFIRWSRPTLSRTGLVVNVGDSGGADLAAAILKTELPGAAALPLFTYELRGEGGTETGRVADVTATLRTLPRGGVALADVRLSPRALVGLAALAELAGEELAIGIRGAHNAANALGVAALASLAGATSAGIRRGLASFTGVGRRLEVLYERNGRVVIDDYGHHPAAIDATLATVRAIYPNRTLWLAYEPLTYHRTASLLEPLAASCAAADRVFVAEIHASRDPDLSIASSLGLAEAIVRRGGQAEAPGAVEATATALLAAAPADVVVLVMGGGRSTEMARLIADGFSTRA